MRGWELADGVQEALAGGGAEEFQARAQGAIDRLGVRPDPERQTPENDCFGGRICSPDIGGGIGFGEAQPLGFR